MLTATPMPKKKNAEAKATSVKIDKDLARRLNVIAAHKDQNLQDLVADVLMAYLRAEYSKTGDEIKKGN